MERLQKILSQAGIASRRASEQLMLEGRVTVNGATVRELGTKADPARDDIRVDGRRIKVVERHRYLLLNKPRGYVTTRSDPRAAADGDRSAARRARVRLPGRPARLRLGRAAAADQRRRPRRAADASAPRRARVYEARVLGVPDAHDLAAAAARHHDRRPPHARRQRSCSIAADAARAHETFDAEFTVREGRNRAGAEDVRRDRPPGRAADARRDRAACATAG